MNAAWALCAVAAAPVLLAVYALVAAITATALAEFAVLSRRSR